MCSVSVAAAALIVPELFRTCFPPHACSGVMSSSGTSSPSPAPAQFAGIDNCSWSCDEPSQQGFDPDALQRHLAILLQPNSTVIALEAAALALADYCLNVRRANTITNTSLCVLRTLLTLSLFISFSTNSVCSAQDDSRCFCIERGAVAMLINCINNRASFGKGDGGARLISRLANAAAVIAGACDTGRSQLLQVQPTCQSSLAPPACNSAKQFRAWNSCMQQLQLLAQPTAHDPDDADQLDCVEWLAILAAAVPITSRGFAEQLAMTGLDTAAQTLALQLQIQTRIVTVASLAQCCYNIMKAGGSSSSCGADAMLRSGSAKALVQQLQRQALMHPRNSSSAITAVCRALVVFSHGSTARAQLLASYGAVSCAAEALRSTGHCAAAAAALVQFATVTDAR
jgi:hypothetical protein